MKPKSFFLIPMVLFFFCGLLFSAYWLPPLLAGAYSKDRLLPIAYSEDCPRSTVYVSNGPDQVALLATITPAYTVSSGGTDWTADATMKALYYFETSPGFTQDSKGTNHIDDFVSANPMTTTGAQKVEGSASALCDADGEGLGCSAVTTGFPCLDTTTKMTVGLWFRPASSGFPNEYAGILLCAGRSADWGFWIGFGINETVPKFLVRGAADYYTAASDITLVTTGKWYFIAGSYEYVDGTNDKLNIYVRASDAGSSSWQPGTTRVVGTLPDNSDMWFAVGLHSDNGDLKSAQGDYDALAVFNGTAMTQAQLDSVFTNGWDGNGW
jgi:hypothetical protein